MTMHVFIVDERTFRLHLKYLFVGTGAGDHSIDFNYSSTTSLHHSTERNLTAMIADGNRLRQGDLIVFYLQASSGNEGKFFGIFQVDFDGVFLDPGGVYLYNELGKKLTIRQCISPYEVYSLGVTEWEALDEIRSISSPSQMLWSLIYRKLKGNRGNTMLTIYEAERLFDLIRRKNNHFPLNACAFDFDGTHIIGSSTSYNYEGDRIPVNILPRLVAKHDHNRKLKYEVQLQCYLVQNLAEGTNVSLDNALQVAPGTLEWLGNEVSCGVGMQRIDVMFSKTQTKNQRILCPVELKARVVNDDDIRQLERYIDWIEQYYVPNRPSIVQPILICKGNNALPGNVLTSFLNFNSRGSGRYLPLLYVEYKITNNNITFEQVIYL